MEKIKVNKYPFFLWLNYKSDVTIDHKKNIVHGSERDSNFQKASTLEVIFLKYIFMLPLLFVFRIPNSISDVIAIGLALIVVLFLSMIYKYKQSNFSTIAAITSFVIFLLFFTHILTGRVINAFVGYTMFITIIAYLVNDYIKRDINSYYKLIDVKNIGKITVAKKSEKKRFKVPFTQKYLLKRNGFDFSFNYNFGGYYFSILQGETNE